MEAYEVYTDGSCRMNTGKGGWGFVILKNEEIVYKDSGSVEHTTNNRMELQAAIAALLLLASLSPSLTRVNVYSDSTYLCRGMNEWVKGWKKRNWNMTNGHPMKNVDLWQQLDALNVCFLHVKWQWVRGHSGHKFNEIADQLAQEASE